ncbi:MAG: nitroreductase family protein, partial [Planctomycetes bacterium]|nr:nitroreductase family protein [Planctomycetota bacterium]
MEVREAIERRRAYRSLDPAPISDELIRDLAESASLAPSCFNNQPWRFVFV